MSIVNKWQSSVIRDRPDKKEWIGAAIGAVGAIAGALINKKSSDKAIKSQERMVENQEASHDVLQRLSGGKYGDYLKNYAYASPEEQGQFARDFQSTMYPELNPWELAGSSSAGVAGSMGSDANDVASKGAQIAANERMQRMQLQTQLQQTKIQADTQMTNSMIQAGTQMAVARENNNTQRYGIDTQAQTQAAGQAIDRDRLNAQMPQMVAAAKRELSQTQLNYTTAGKVTQETVSIMLNHTGIELSNKEKELAVKIMESSLKEKIRQQRFGASAAGKHVTDLFNMAEDAINKAKEILPAKTPDPYIDPNLQNQVIGTQGAGTAPISNQTKAYIRSLQ